jgi:hypothetical protein
MPASFDGPSTIASCHVSQHGNSRSRLRAWLSKPILCMVSAIMSVRLGVTVKEISPGVPMMRATSAVAKSLLVRADEVIE